MGAIYALVALGFVTISRASQIINFAQGEFVMLGGVITFFLLNGVRLPYPLAALIAASCSCPCMKWQPNMIMRASQKNRMSKPVIISVLG